MDEVYTEDLNLANLPDLVSKDFAAHWEVSTKFLEILSKVWPSILEAEGVIDSADRRNRLIKRLAQHWATHPPEHPVIAAGSTGSIPATLALLKSIANMPKGCIVLPGLDLFAAANRNRTQQNSAMAMGAAKTAA
jgi:ATP-dependent helicase/nuclease subunit B